MLAGVTSWVSGSSLAVEATVSIAVNAADRGGFSGGFVSADAGWSEAESGEATAGVAVAAC